MHARLCMQVTYRWELDFDGGCPLHHPRPHDFQAAANCAQGESGADVYKMDLSPLHLIYPVIDYLDLVPIDYLHVHVYGGLSRAHTPATLGNSAAPGFVEPRSNMFRAVGVAAHPPPNPSPGSGKLIFNHDFLLRAGHVWEGVDTHNLSLLLRHRPDNIRGVVGASHAGGT